MKLFPWGRYSKKLIAKIDNPAFVGSFTQEDARGMRLVTSKEGEIKDANVIIFYWLVDEDDGVIADVKYQVFGQSALIGAAEVACELLLRKNYDQARRISADLIDKQVRDKNDVPAFPEETFSHINLALFAIEDAADQCTDIPFAPAYVSPPISSDLGGEGYPGWKELSKEHKISVIEEVIDKDIRPYIELDAGGVKVLDFINDKELLIAYQGSCTSCHSATGSTLNAIEQILRSKLDPEIVVTPDMSFLTGGAHNS